MIIFAEEAECPAIYSKTKGNSVATRKGLSYERAVAKGFAKVSNGSGFSVVHNPWYRYRTESDSGMCSPDILLIGKNIIYVIEVKYTYVSDAINKLRQLYCPVVSFVHGLPTHPLVVCKKLTPAVAQADMDFTVATALSEPVMHWLGHTPISL